MEIKVTAKAKKQLQRLPKHIISKFEYWLDLIDYIGLVEARKYKGFHDEPLKGVRNGQRSVRLSKSYRVIYLDLKVAIEILEVNKHEY